MLNRSARSYNPVGRKQTRCHFYDIFILMKANLGLTPGSAEIYIPGGAHESAGIGADRYVHEYDHWHLVLQPEDKRRVRGAASGLLIAKREVILVTDLNTDEWADMANILQDGDAARRLCEAAEVTFTGHFTGPAFNNGSLAGQTQAQVHAHIYPVIEEDLPAPGARNGMGAMVEALRRLRL
jgi:diadenosine tetraphosphate (Ap4A) HIT family hydrolase